jgi:hypothetical protein
MNNFTLCDTLTLLAATVCFLAKQYASRLLYEDLGNEIQLPDWHV